MTERKFFPGRSLVRHGPVAPPGEARGKVQAAARGHQDLAAALHREGPEPHVAGTQTSAEDTLRARAGHLRYCKGINNV